MVDERLRKKVRFTMDLTIRRYDLAKIITDQEIEEIKRTFVEMHVLPDPGVKYQVRIKERDLDSDHHPQSVDYLENGTERCPFCKKLSVQKNPDLFFPEFGYLPCRCLECDRGWSEVWEIRGIVEE